MKISSFLKKTAVQCCVIYTFLITAVYTVGYLVSASDSFIPKFSMIWMLLSISLVIAFAERLLETSLSFALRIVLHFASCLIGFLLIFIVCGGYATDSSSTVIGTFLFTGIYIVVNLVRFIVMGRRERKISEKSEYKKSFQ